MSFVLAQYTRNAAAEDGVGWAVVPINLCSHTGGNKRTVG